MVHNNKVRMDLIKKTRQIGIGKREDVVGRTFGNLVVLRSAGIDSNRQRLWECLCKCGNTHIARSVDLSDKGVRSCGCFKRRERVEQDSVDVSEKYHGHSRSRGGRKESPTYSSWGSMVRRCTGPGQECYSRYGAVGITVFHEWLDFRNFLKDMGERPPGTSIDRIDSKGNYEPGNCRWATARTQSQNRCCAIDIEFNGVKKNLKEWCEQLGLKYTTVYQRLYRYGWSVEDSFTIAPISGGNYGA